MKHLKFPPLFFFSPSHVLPFLCLRPMERQTSSPFVEDYVFSISMMKGGSGLWFREKMKKEMMSRKDLKKSLVEFFNWGGVAGVASRLAGVNHGSRMKWPAPALAEVLPSSADMSPSWPSQTPRTHPDLTPNFPSPSTRPRTVFSVPQSIETKHSFPSTSYHCVPILFPPVDDTFLLWSHSIHQRQHHQAAPACVLYEVEDGEQKETKKKSVERVGNICQFLILPAWECEWESQRRILETTLISVRLDENAFFRLALASVVVVAHMPRCRHRTHVERLEHRENIASFIPPVELNFIGASQLKPHLNPRAVGPMLFPIS